MTSVEVLVENNTTESCAQSWDVVSNVFDQADPEQLRHGMSLFGDETCFFAIEQVGVYVSVLFVTPVDIAGTRLGGIGGVCTRPEYSSMGYGRLLLERVLLDTSKDYPALLLWTRIPEYFLRFGFVEMPEIFVATHGGSTPMLFLHRNKYQSMISALRGLPRERF